MALQRSGIGCSIRSGVDIAITGSNVSRVGLIERIVNRARRTVWRYSGPGTTRSAVSALTGVGIAAIIHIEDRIVSVAGSPGRRAIIIAKSTTPAVESTTPGVKSTAPGIESATPGTVGVGRTPGIPAVPTVPAGVGITPTVPAAESIPAVPAIESSKVIPAVHPIVIIVDQYGSTARADERIVVRHIHVNGIEIAEPIVRTMEAANAGSIVIIVRIVIKIVVRGRRLVVIIIRRVAVRFVGRIAGISVRIVVQVIVLSLSHAHRCEREQGN